MAELYIGLMSGTSMDGIDAVLADLAGTPHILATKSAPFDSALRKQLFELCADSNHDMHQLLSLDTILGQQFAQAALDVMQQARVTPNKVRAIGSHGQTIRHEPHAPSPYSLQIGNPSLIAEITSITTVADFRRRDIAAGGEGAPLVPAFHNKVFRTSENDRVIVNIGGIANITVLPKDRDRPVTGFDTGPGNLLMDGWATKHLGTAFDAEGQWSGDGTVQKTLLHALLSDPFFKLKPPKSTGREYFHQQWLDKALHGMNPTPSPQNIQATLCELTACSIAQAITSHAPQAQEILVCGGGVHNKTLMTHLKSHLSERHVDSTEEFGLHPDWVEAAAFAWLAKQTIEGKPGNLPSVTGARHPVVLGGIYKA